MHHKSMKRVEDLFEEIHQEVLCLRTLKKGNTRNLENYRPIYFRTVLFMIETIIEKKKIPNKNE